MANRQIAFRKSTISPAAKCAGVVVRSFGQHCIRPIYGIGEGRGVDLLMRLDAVLSVEKMAAI
jgi:hypothetical protein